MTVPETDSPTITPHTHYHYPSFHLTRHRYHWAFTFRDGEQLSLSDREMWEMKHLFAGLDVPEPAHG